jgi:hypothetical protein
VDWDSARRWPWRGKDCRRGNREGLHR